MHTTWERTALQQAADEVVVRRTVRSSAIGATIFGALALFAGVAPPTDALLIGIGAVLALVGLWNLTNPQPVGLAFYAAALVMVGLYNIGSGFADAAAGGHPTVFWQILGVWQIVWGVQGFGRWRRFQNAFTATVSDESRQTAQQMMDDLRKTNAKKSADVIEFTTGVITPRQARIRLMPEMALCVVGNVDDVRLLTRGELDVEAPDAKLGKAARVMIHLGGTTLKAHMPAQSLERFRGWKRGAAAPMRAAA